MFPSATAAADFGSAGVAARKCGLGDGKSEGGHGWVWCLRRSRRWGWAGIPLPQGRLEDRRADGGDRALGVSARCGREGALQDAGTARRAADAGDPGWCSLQRVQPARTREGLWAQGRTRAGAQNAGEDSRGSVCGSGNAVPAREGGPRGRVLMAFVPRRLEGPTASGPSSRGLSGNRAGLDRKRAHIPCSLMHRFLPNPSALI